MNNPHFSVTYETESMALATIWLLFICFGQQVNQIYTSACKKILRSDIEAELFAMD